MSKTVKYENCWVRPVITHYAGNNRLAVVLVDSCDTTYAVITKNLVDAEVFNEYCAFVDTNNLPKIEEFLAKYDLAKPTYRWANSGFCTYPEYNFKRLLDAIERGEYGN